MFAVNLLLDASFTASATNWLMMKDRWSLWFRCRLWASWLTCTLVFDFLVFWAGIAKLSFRQIDTFILSQVRLLDGSSNIVNELVHLWHQEVLILIEFLFSISWSLLLRCLSLEIGLFLRLLLSGFLAKWLSSWFDLWLHLEWLIASFLLSVRSFILH